LNTAHRLRLVLLTLLGLLCNGCLFGRIVYYNTPNLDAPSYFDERVVPKSAVPLPLARSEREASFRLTARERSRFRTFDEFLGGEKTHAFIVIKDDAIVYERYFHGATAETLLPCFSMSKSVAAILVGRALEQHLLESVDDPITKYVPEVASKPRYSEVKVDHLLRMTSGIDFAEESMKSATFYYTTHLRDVMYSFDVDRNPGEHYLYGSANMQLLWAALHERLHGETVSRYFSDQVWTPMGAEFSSSWSLDSEESGVEKFFGGFNARARDYARFGLLFLHGGTLGGRPIISRDWVTRSLEPDPVAGWVETSDGWVRRGKYQWFLSRDGKAYFAKGYNGQYVFVVPEKRVVFVRFGEGYGDISWPILFGRLAASL
jgi:CubicO group peptidase (beta-lactamase class C family)